MNRREFIRSLGFATASATAGSWLLSSCHTEEDMIGTVNWIVEGDFGRALSSPPVITDKNVRLTAQVSFSQLLGSGDVSTLSYHNGILGPMIRVNSGDTVNVSLSNQLNESTNIHWHGLILPEEMDGHPKDVAGAGMDIQYVLPVRQRAGTYWYHPHAHGTTARQVFMGMAGMFVVNDAEEAALHLPSGEFEVPLIIQDKHFNGSSLDYSPSNEEIMSGYLGEHIVVNGIYAPYLNVDTGWYRFRVLNGSTARLYELALSNGMEFHIIGTDGGLLKAPEKVSSSFLAPGERLDILVDFSSLTPGSDVFLVSRKYSKYNIQGRQSFNILRFHVDRTSSRDFNLPSTLSVIDPIPSSSAVAKRIFDVSALAGGHGDAMSGHSINGMVFDVNRVDETVKSGSTEIWEFDNTGGDEIHPMHIHGVQFQVLERNGGRNTLIPSEKGWKDTVLVMPGEKVSVIMTFPQYKGVFVFHCHNLEHEDDGMMLNYRIE